MVMEEVDSPAHPESSTMEIEGIPGAQYIIPVNQGN
jgi:hypothetical protein